MGGCPFLLEFHTHPSRFVHDFRFTLKLTSDLSILVRFNPQEQYSQVSIKRSAYIYIYNYPIVESITYLIDIDHGIYIVPWSTFYLDKS